MMRYCFDYLEHADRAIAADAFSEFLHSTDPDIRTAARAVSAERLRRWLGDRRTDPERLRLYAFLLACQGCRDDAALLRRRLDRLVKQPQPPLLDGVLTGYTLLDPAAGWAYTRGLFKGGTTPFGVRYAALRAARYFQTSHPGVVTEKDILGVVHLALEQPDIADVAINYLLQWRCWKLTEPILGLFDREGFEAPILRRGVVRYALQCPDARAAWFIAGLRKADPSFVAEMEDAVKQEAEPPAAKP